MIATLIAIISLLDKFGFVTWFVTSEEALANCIYMDQLKGQVYLSGPVSGNW